MGLLAHLLLEAFLVAVELFEGQRADDAAEVARDRFLDGRADLLGRHAQEALRGLADVVHVAPHLHLRHGLDVDGDALVRIDVLEVDVERHHPQGEHLVLLPGGEDERAAAADDAEAFGYAPGVFDLVTQELPAAVDDQRLVRPGLLVKQADEHVDEDDGEEDGTGDAE